MSRRLPTPITAAPYGSDEREGLGSESLALIEELETEQ